MRLATPEQSLLPVILARGSLLELVQAPHALLFHRFLMLVLETALLTRLPEQLVLRLATPDMPEPFPLHVPTPFGITPVHAPAQAAPRCLPSPTPARVTA